MRIVGIDPGVTGAISLMIDGRTPGILDLPTMKVGTYTQINPHQLRQMLAIWEPDIVVIEDNAANGGNGSLANFSMGLSMGVIVGVLGAMSHPFVRMKPQKWKKAVGLGSIKGTATERKEAGRQRALELWPEHEKLKFKKDHNRADAALIAEAHRRET